MTASSLSFRQIVEASHDVVWTLDPRQLVYTYVSPSVTRLLGWTPDELIGKPAGVALRPEDFARIRALITQLMASPPPGPVSRTREFDQPHRDGHLVPTEVVTTVVLGEDGRVVEILGVSRDITDRRRAAAEQRELELRLLQSQKLESLGVLAGGVAHEFNNLLTSILGNADLALQDLAPASPVRQNITAIESASRRAAEISQQLLAYSGRGRFVVGPTGLAGLVRDMSRMLELTVSKKTSLRTEVPDDLPLVEADADQLRQMVVQLVSNASDAIGDKGGAVHLTAWVADSTPAAPIVDHLRKPLDPGRYVVLEVADSGVGMDDETLARLFDPFFSTKFTGRGLGLAAVLGIVRGHRGAVQVDSERGKGTTVRVFLPALSNPGAVVQPSKPAASPVSPAAATVLVVDDEEGVRTVAIRMVERCGYRAVGAADGQEALQLVSDAPRGFDCVLLDLTMPRMGGEEALREMRLVAPDLPVLLCSGYPAQELTEQFAGRGVSGFIQKPFRLADVRTRLQHLLASS